MCFLGMMRECPSDTGKPSAIAKAALFSAIRCRSAVQNGHVFDGMSVTIKQLGDA
jgi:hypothetical protein